MALDYRIGVDENGLGARLGPLVVTAVLARVDDSGRRVLSRKLPKKIRADLDDSKRLVAHGNVGLGEAWARALVPEASSPAELFSRISLEGEAALTAPCPRHVRHQCWSDDDERFAAPPELLDATRDHLGALRRRGIDVLRVQTSVLCTKRLNDAKGAGHNRFVSDLHAMERLVLAMRELTGADVHAVCGKVGGIGDYSRFFGPLSHRLHAVIAQQRRHSAYHFPKLGELHFVQDADAKDPLVMLASLVGKWVRELLMERVVRHYDAEPSEDAPRASGYNDPVTARFVEATALVRKKRAVPDTCFERARDADG